MGKIVFIGLGNMGSPMAVNLIKAGHEVIGYDLSEQAMQSHKANGGQLSVNLEEELGAADAAITMLPAGQHVNDAYLTKLEMINHCGSDTVLIDCSTIDVATTRHIAKAAADKNRKMIDAPVSGGVGGATAGTLTFMVGGSVEAFEAAKPYLEIMGKTIVHAGEAGNGQAAKICNNMILGISMIGVCEAFTLAEKLGLDHQKLFDISSTASGQCWSLNTYCPVPGPVPTSPANNDYQPGFSSAMMLKDLYLAQEASNQCKASTPLGAQAAQIYALFNNMGHGDVDFSGIIQFLRKADEN